MRHADPFVARSLEVRAGRQAVGFAWAAKMKKEDLATIVYFGEGATSSSEFHNGMNFAGVFKTPTIFFCRNNGWAISVPTEKQTGSATFAEKGVAYGIPGVRVDGNDLFAVVKVTRDAAAFARNHLHCCVKLPSAIAAKRMERIAGNAFAMDTNQGRFCAGKVAFNYGFNVANIQKFMEVAGDGTCELIQVCDAPPPGA